MPCAEGDAVARFDAVGVAAVRVDVELDRNVGLEQRFLELHCLAGVRGIIDPG